MYQAAHISWAELALAFLMIAGAIVLSRLQGLNLERRLIVASLRTTIQLIAIGYILGWVLDQQSFPLLVGVVTLQLVVAIWTAGGLQSPALPGSRLIALYALLPTYILIMAILVGLVIRATPWWEPRIVLTLGGMVLGNTLTGVALALNNYRKSVGANRSLIMARLALGVTWLQAVEQERRDAAYAAVLPTISAMLTVGVVALPGMMTGQIIAGAEVLGAVKYQIVVMFMLAGAVSLATAIALSSITRRARFEADQI